jgi:hypothetical protein
MNDKITSTGMPDAFDRQLGALHGLPDIVKTQPSTIRHIPTLGIGGSQMFVVQTYRQKEIGDTIFLEVAGADGTLRVALPPSVANAIARQRDALTSKSRAKGAAQAVATRKALGIVPGFLKRGARARKEAK